MMAQKTHREVKDPRVSARYLADYMAATEPSRRTILRGCKYPPIARVVQHDDAKAAISAFIRANGEDLAGLEAKANSLRSRMVTSDFERDLLDHNADYIDRFAKVHKALVLPDAELLAPGKASFVMMSGIKVSPELQFRLRRLTKTNKVRVGAGMLRYAKGKPLPKDVAEWQSAFLLGFLGLTADDPSHEPEHKLCLTIDAFLGIAHAAPTDSVRKFQQMDAACATIAEWWPNIAAPPGAVF